MFPHVKTFLLAIAQTNSKRNLAKSHKITFTLFYLHLILFVKTSTELDSPLSARFLKGCRFFNLRDTPSHTLNFELQEHLCILWKLMRGLTSPYKYFVFIENICNIYRCTQDPVWHTWKKLYLCFEFKSYILKKFFVSI